MQRFNLRLVQKPTIESLPLSQPKTISQSARWPFRRIALALGFLLFFCDVLSAEEATGAEKGFFTIVFSGGIVGAILVFTLLGLSMIAAYLVFEQLLSIRRNELLPQGLHDRVYNALLNGSIKDAETTCHENPSFLSFVLLQGISEIDYGWSSVEKALEDALTEQSSRLFRKVEYLNVIGNIAPMVGLLGTVVGMIFAFQNVATAPPGGATAPDLAEGIYQALVTTVGGLIVAIPSLAAFAIFRNRIDQFVAEAAYLAQHVFGPLRRKKK
ncbi:MAG: MotA/TolQ/ExbB proton channel family protein [Planctomycetota bacterium]|nr:MotA/TolQ/ExbB proton channel family protein [Planctomycetota bacterium]